jgi:hypothetical protein
MQAAPKMKILLSTDLPASFACFHIPPGTAINLRLLNNIAAE